MVRRVLILRRTVFFYLQRFIPFGIVIDFPYSQYLPRVFKCLQCGNMFKTLVEKMDHESSLFGLPPIHMEAEAIPGGKTQMELKREVILDVMGGCLERIRFEMLLRMEQRLEEKGLEGFKSILNGKSIIDELMKISGE
jgi:hypothetical protein